MSLGTKQVVIHDGAIHCKGWPCSGGGRGPERIGLSADGGFSCYGPYPTTIKDKQVDVADGGLGTLNPHVTPKDV